MNFRRYLAQEDTNGLIDLAPLIDVVFILLIFFMVTTTFSRESEIEVKLPEAASEEQRDQLPNTIEIIIDENGRYFVNGKSLVNSQIRTIKRALSIASKDAKESPVVLISADSNTPHQAVITAMDAARQSGLTRVSFTTQSAEE
ncbi:MAG: biopolymer transporter ExbD [Pseudomonadota bacterium]